jgi:hypothetical protein
MLNSAFCAYHKKHGCPRKSPLSGFEPPYEPLRWNGTKEIRETHNCFAYAMNINDPKQIVDCKKNKNCNVPFHQPGSASGHDGFSSEREKSCSEMIARILGDNPGIRMSTFTDQCPQETSKIAIVVDPKEDYHFFRQDTNGWWSHKPGGTPVTNKDSSGRPIYDPKVANRNYMMNGGHLNYDMFCSYLCVPRTRILHLKVGGGKYKITRSRRSRQGLSSASLSRTAKRKRTD